MKILFMRHAQDQDDIDNKYGGWSDSSLSEEGIRQIESRIDTIKSLNIPFERIITSPLKRAFQSADILSKELNLEMEVLESLKEWNKYGILTSMDKELAYQKYPQLVQKINNSQYILGAERMEDLIERIDFSINILKTKGLRNFIVISHGGILSNMIKKYLNKSIKKTGDGGYYLVDLNHDKWELIQTDGIDFE